MEERQVKVPQRLTDAFVDEFERMGLTMSRGRAEAVLDRHIESLARAALKPVDSVLETFGGSDARTVARLSAASFPTIAIRADDSLNGIALERGDVTDLMALLANGVSDLLAGSFAMYGQAACEIIRVLAEGLREADVTELSGPGARRAIGALYAIAVYGRDVAVTSEVSRVGKMFDDALDASGERVIPVTLAVSS